MSDQRWEDFATEEPGGEYDVGLYDGSHYAWSLEHDWPHLQRAICGVMALLGVPGSHIDVGCGVGAAISLTDKVVIGDVIGLELDPLALRDADREAGRGVPMAIILRQDLRQTWDLHRAFQLVTCWEVAEHLPAEAAGPLTESVAAHVTPGGHLVWTAAQPGQAGLAHINCQSKEYWRARLEALGLEYLDQESRFLEVIFDHTVNPLLHLRDNVQVFRRPE